MTKTATHKWIFPARFRAGTYGWKSSRLACQRLREAVSEIKKVAKKEPDLAAEGAVRLIERLWPALEHVDSSSGALGSAVNKTLDQLLPVIINAPADANTRQKWLERLWQAMEDDGVDYLGPVGDRWGEVCGSVQNANQWGGVDADFEGVLDRLQSGQLFSGRNGLLVLSAGGRTLSGSARPAGAGP